MDIGSAVSRKAGVTERQLMELAQFETSDAFNDLERLVLRLAGWMTRTPANVPDDLIAALRGHLSDRQIVELASSIAWENYRARFNRAFDVKAAGFSQGAFCVLPHHGDLFARGQ